MRRALVAAILVITCNGVLAAEKETRQQKIDRLCREGKWAEAEPYTEAELASLERLGPAGESLIADLRVRRALIFNSQHKWQDAIDETKEAKVSHLNREQRFHLYTQQGIAEHELENHANAVKSFSLALEAAGDKSNKELNPDCIAAADTCIHLANALLAQQAKRPDDNRIKDEKDGAYRRALLELQQTGQEEIKRAGRLLQRAMVIYEENLGEDHPNVRTIRERLAELNEKMHPEVVPAK